MDQNKFYDQDGKELDLSGKALRKKAALEAGKGKKKKPSKKKSPKKGK